MKNILFLTRFARSSAARAGDQWFAQRKRYLLWVPRQTPATQSPRPSGIFGVLVSPYQ